MSGVSISPFLAALSSSDAQCALYTKRDGGRIAHFGLDSIVKRHAVTWTPERRANGQLQGNLRVRQPGNYEEWEGYSVRGSGKCRAWKIIL